LYPGYATLAKPRETAVLFANGSGLHRLLSGSKMFQLSERRWKLNLRGEAFNLLNHPLCGGPDTNYQDARFGMLPVGQQNFPRLIQVSAKVLW
jgi:hypothetical protein